MDMKEKLEVSKEYLRARRIYILEYKFKPTSAVHTDIWRTWKRAQKQKTKNYSKDQELLG